MTESFEAVVVGAGPNGLVAAVTLAEAGISTLLVEAETTVGGGTRTAELTLPGFLHDVCSAIHPLAMASPALSRLPLTEHGLEIIHPPVPVAHPLDDGGAVVMRRSIDVTAAGLGQDGLAYSYLMAPLLRDWEHITRQLMGPLRPPRHPGVMARFALDGVRSATGLAAALFTTEPARALFAGIAGHSILPLTQRPTAGMGLFLGLLAHAVGWPLARGGSQSIADALCSYFQSLGGKVITGQRVETLDQLPPHQVVILNLTPRQVIKVARKRLPDRYVERLGRYRYGPGVFKVDWALDGPVPWASELCSLSATVHVGGTMNEIVNAEEWVAKGIHPQRPYVIVAQPSLFDASRAPKGKHTLWGYCHVPHGSEIDMTNAIENQIERFAPGFRDLVLERSAMGPQALERHNANLVGGDIVGGAQDLVQLFARPLPRLNPYTTPDRRIFVCSASTPPGGGVHGMGGYYAARSVVKRHFS
ncbi:MAG: NAD(P)/FAD-dependent oxidoreductase [Actinomycetota bacterium]|nr:NAD(P)/FAD-dependent oxidoreductase [Actinomycetota bacterium]